MRVHGIADNVLPLMKLSIEAATTRRRAVRKKLSSRRWRACQNVEIIAH